MTRDLRAVWGAPATDVYVASNDPSAYAYYVLRGVRGATISVSNTTPVLAGIGVGMSLTATAYSGATAIPGVTFTWSSSNTGVVTVSATGRITAVAVGSATITVSAVGGVSASAAVTVAQ